MKYFLYLPAYLLVFSLPTYALREEKELLNKAKKMITNGTILNENNNSYFTYALRNSTTKRLFLEHIFPQSKGETSYPENIDITKEQLLTCFEMCEVEEIIPRASAQENPTIPYAEFATWLDRKGFLLDDKFIAKTISIFAKKMPSPRFYYDNVYFKTTIAQLYMIPPVEPEHNSRTTIVLAQPNPEQYLDAYYKLLKSGDTKCVIISGGRKVTISSHHSINNMDSDTKKHFLKDINEHKTQKIEKLKENLTTENLAYYNSNKGKMPPLEDYIAIIREKGNKNSKEIGTNSEVETSKKEKKITIQKGVEKQTGKQKVLSDSQIDKQGNSITYAFFIAIGGALISGVGYLFWKHNLRVKKGEKRNRFRKKRPS